jgi:D-alanyl-D-alanine carboxypeptidase
LIKAKTGTLNGTANLAGYVESGDRDTHLLFSLIVYVKEAWQKAETEYRRPITWKSS